MDDIGSILMFIICSIAATFLATSFGIFVLDNTKLRECIIHTKAERCAILAVPVDEKGRPL